MKQLSFFVAILCLLATVYANTNDGKQGQQNNEKQSGSISGRITIQGKPAAGVELELRPIIDDDISDPITGRFKTDNDGRYQFADLKSSYYWLKVITDEYVNAKGTDIDMGYAKAGRRILVTDGETIIDANIDLTLGGTISGRIVDVDGKPIANEAVFIKVPHKYTGI
jgi:hypothetical protein